MEVLCVYYARALASIYYECLYAEMYSISLATVSKHDYASELSNLIYTHLKRSEGWFQVTQFETP